MENLISNREHAIKLWHEEILPINKRLKMKIIGYTHYIEHLTEPELDKCIIAMEKFIVQYVSRVNKAYNIVPEKTWAFYKSMHMHDTQEQILLKFVENEYRNAWLKSPLYKKEFTVQTKVKKVKTKVAY